MPRPICVKCGREMFVRKNDQVVKEKEANGFQTIWFADILKCPQCGFEIACHFGDGDIVSGPVSGDSMEFAR